MPPFSTLISTGQLAALIASPRTEPRFVILDCRFSLSDTTRGRRDYRTSHIPGSIYVHLDHDLAGAVTPQSGRHPLPDMHSFRQRIHSWGITNRTQVVVYDDAGGAIAGRLWWMIKWFGHHLVAVLDGGYPAWEKSGQRLSTQSGPGSQSTRSEGFTPKINHRMSIHSDEMAGLLKADQIALFDARAKPRFTGAHEPIDAIAGHIPGAVNLPFAQNLDSAGLFLKPAQLKARFATVLNAPARNKQIVHMCGSGVTACHNILAMEIAGVAINQPIRLYVGSWSEWITDPSRAIGTTI